MQTQVNDGTRTVLRIESVAVAVVSMTRHATPGSGPGAFALHNGAERAQGHESRSATGFAFDHLGRFGRALPEALRCAKSRCTAGTPA